MSFKFWLSWIGAGLAAYGIGSLIVSLMIYTAGFYGNFSLNKIKIYITVGIIILGIILYLISQSKPRLSVETDETFQKPQPQVKPNVTLKLDEEKKK